MCPEKMAIQSCTLANNGLYKMPRFAITSFTLTTRLTSLDPGFIFKRKMQYETLLCFILALCANYWAKADNTIDNDATMQEDISSIALEEKDRQVNTFNQESLNAHNAYRRKHGAPALFICPRLNKVAQSYAEKIAAQGSLVHSKNDFGENLYYSWGMEPNGKQPVDAFYREIRYYDFNSPKFSKKTGHFTQVVWKSTQMVGIGKAKSRNGATFVVYNYYPPGNYLGQFAANVLPAQ